MNFGNCYCKQPILNHKSLDAFAPDLFTSYGFTQIIDIPTRVTNDTISLIDLFFADSTEDIICHGTLPRISDHDGIVASYNIELNRPKTNSKTVYDYANTDVVGLVNFIKSFNFDTTVFSHPIEFQAELYSKILIDAFNQFVPTKTVTV